MKAKTPLLVAKVKVVDFKLRGFPVFPVVSLKS